jgi:hypothetical protein
MRESVPFPVARWIAHSGQTKGIEYFEEKLIGELLDFGRQVIRG